MILNDVDECLHILTVFLLCGVPQGGIPGRVLPHGSTGSGSPVTVPWSSQQQLLAHGAASGTVVYRDQVPVSL